MSRLLDLLNGMDKGEREAFALRCGTTVGYLRKSVSVRQKLRASTCALIERESGGAITRQELRPDDWQVIWPELASVQPSEQGVANA